jgi:two-component system sensor kinase FixL
MACLAPNERGVTTTIEHGREELLALVDKVQIEQVIVNLIRNAFDAMTDVAEPALRIAIDRNGEGMAIISVSDNGPGIDDAVFEGLFKPFVSTKGRKGLGIGLSVCQSVIESHNGKIWAERPSGNGATFSFTLPLLALEETRE